jgi:hypothetical protein
VRRSFQRKERGVANFGNQMDREITVEYPAELVKDSVKKYWINFIGISGFITLIAIAIIFLVLVWSGDRSWLFGVVLASFVIYSGIIAFSYFRLLNMAMQKVRLMGSPIATVRFCDHSISLEADSGKSEIPWRQVKKILQYENFWLVVIGSGSYFTLPIAKFDDELRMFILESTDVRTTGR